MTENQAVGNTEGEDISVAFELFPVDSSEVQIRTVALGMNPLVLLSVPGDGTIGVTVSSMTAEEALHMLSFGTMALQQYIAAEGK